MILSLNYLYYYLYFFYASIYLSHYYFLYYPLNDHPFLYLSYVIHLLLTILIQIGFYLMQYCYLKKYSYYYEQHQIIFFFPLLQLLFYVITMKSFGHCYYSFVSSFLYQLYFQIIIDVFHRTLTIFEHLYHLMTIISLNLIILQFIYEHQLNYDAFYLNFLHLFCFEGLNLNSNQFKDYIGQMKDGQMFILPIVKENIFASLNCYLTCRIYNDSYSNCIFVQLAHFKDYL